MSATVSISLSPAAAALLRRAPQWPAAMAQAIAKGMDYENELTIGHAQARKLSRRSATTLGVVTNRLRSSLNQVSAVINGNSVISSIGTNVAYAGVHEFGFDGRVQVKAFTRRVNTYAGGTKFVATLQKSGRIVKKKAKITATGTQQVRAHSRQLKMPERSFIRSSIRERLPAYGATLSARVIAAFANPPAA
jgi:phage gpG-like protein